MKYIIDDEEYNVIINKKGNKNTYIRIDKDLNIVVNTSYFITKGRVLSILNNNNNISNNSFCRLKLCIFKS